MKWRRSKNLFFIALLASLSAFALSPYAAGHGGENPCVTMEYGFTSPEATTIHYTLNHFVQDTVFLNGEECILLSVDQGGYVQMDQSGQPQLPALASSLIIPDQARMQVRVIDQDYYEIQGVNVAPYKGPITRNVDPSSVPYTFGEVYGQDAFYPAQVAELSDPYVLRDVRGIVVKTYPIQYNPVQKTLRVTTHLTVEVAAAGQGGMNTIDRSRYGYKPDRSFEALYETQFANYSVMRTEPPVEDGDILIISHGVFMDNMQPYIDLKTAKGFNVSIVDVAAIGNNYTAIFNYIMGIYDTSNLAYVLLVGDYNEVRPGSYNSSESDPAYSTMTADWYPDLFVGRFSASTEAHVDTQVERTVAYESEGHDVSLGGYHSRALGVASNQGPGHYGEYDDEHEDLIRDELLAVGFTSVERSYDYFGTKTIITDAINNGVRAVNYTGHGGPTGWGNGGGYSNSDVHALVNVGMLPWVTSVACNVGEFSYGECFHEAWHRATHNGQPTGAIASYGSSVGQYWNEPMYGQGNHVNSGKFGAVDRFWSQKNWSVGGCFFGGSCTMMDICGNAGRDMFMTWIIFGDPSIRLQGLLGPQTLTSDGWAVPIDTPTQIRFTVQPGAEHAGKYYCMLGGMSGTYPGFDLPNGYHVPLNMDTKTFYFFNFYGTSLFQNFMGILDGSGSAVATFDSTSLIPLSPRKVGKSVYWIALIWPIGGDYEFATNAKSFTFTD